MKKMTVTYIDIADVFTHLALTDEQEQMVMDMVSHHVTWGDAYATLITSDSLIYMICEALDASFGGAGGSAIQLFLQGLEDKYWQVIQKDTLINLESS